MTDFNRCVFILKQDITIGKKKKSNIPWKEKREYSKNISNGTGKMKSNVLYNEACINFLKITPKSQHK